MEHTTYRKVIESPSLKDFYKKLEDYLSGMV